LTRIDTGITPQEINEDSTYEKSCISDDEQSFEWGIKEEE